MPDSHSTNIAAIYRPQAWARGLLAGPIALLGSFIIMAGSALWLPQGPAQVNHLILPTLLLPGIWAALFFYAYLARKLWRAYVLITGLISLHLLLIVISAESGLGQ